MKNEKEIGKVLREKLSDLEQVPSDKVWSAIQKDLQKRKNKRIVFIPFWVKTAGIFSIALLFFIFTNPYFSFYNTEKESNSISIGVGTLNASKDFDIEKENKSNNKNGDNVKIANPSLDINSIYTNKRDNKKRDNIDLQVKTTEKSNSTTVVNKNLIKAIQSKRNFSDKNNSKKTASTNSKEKKVKYPNANATKKRHSNTSESTKTAVVQSGSKQEKLNSKNAATKLEFPKQLDDKIVEAPKKDTLRSKEKKEKRKEIILYPENKKDSTKAIANKFDLYAFVAPNVYSYLSNSSPIDPRLNNNTTTSEIKFSYGLYLSYEITNNWSIRLGVEKTNLNYQTKDAIINTSNYQNINYINSISNASIYSQSNNSSTMTIVQELEYTDIPLEVKYKFIHNKIGVGVIAGLSYLSLTKNNVSVKPQNAGVIMVGEIKDLSNKSFSVNFGLGFDYQLSEKLKLNIEPIVKYHLIDYLNASQNYKPYSIGIQTGLQYSFSFNQPRK
jgi:hypothetical protein